MDWKKALFGEPESRSVPQTPAEPLAADGTILEFIRANQQSALNISTFYRGMQLIATSIAQLPILTKKINGKGDTNVLKSHNTNMLWRDTTNLVDKVTMIRCIIQDVITRGNAYCLINRAADGTPTSLQYVEAGDITINYNKERNTLYYTTKFANGKKVTPQNILHFKLFTRNGINGVSLLSFASNTVDLTNATEAQAKTFFEKGCSNISGVIQATGVVNDKQKKQILNTWSGTFGNSKAGVAVLEGNLRYEPITINPSDSQMLESRQYNASDVCQWLNMNPAQLGIGTVTYKSYEDANADLLTRTLMPYISMIESELSRKLLKEDEQKNIKIILDTALYLRANKAAEADYYTKLVNAGILSINEVRKVLGYSAIEGCDTPIIPYTDISQNQVTNQGNNNDNETEDNGDKEITE